MFRISILAVSFCIFVFFSACPIVAGPVSGGLVLWLDAGDIDGDGNPANNPANGAAVSVWADKAPLQGAQNATQATAAQQPVYVTSGQNGEAAVYFDGNDHLVAANLAFGPFTYFSALRGDSGSVLVYERSINSNNYDGEYLCLTTNLTTNVRRTPTTSPIRSGHNLTTNWGDDGQFRLTEHSFDGTHATHLLYDDGVPQTLTSVLSGNPGSGVVTTSLYIGDRPGLGLGLIGDLAELLVYNRVLDEDERIQVGRYLSHKYDLETAYIPEPASLALLVLGGLGLLLVRRPRQT